MGMLAMFFGYSLKLSARTASLEKKNGSEQKQINELREEIRQLKEQKPVKVRGFYSKSILKQNQNHHEQR